MNASNTPHDNGSSKEPSEYLGAHFGQYWVEGMFATFATQAAQLGELDRRAGDGDFGQNLASAFRRVRNELAPAQPTIYRDWLTAVSRGFLGTGGTSGPLFGMFFRELAGCAAGDEPSIGEFAQGLASGLATVQRYGNAKVGHKTMVDALSPAVQTLASRLQSDELAAGALRQAAGAAIEGAQSTAWIIAKRGRASYVGEISRGVLDPGAVAMALMIEVAANAHDGSAAPADSSWVVASDA